MTYSEPRTEIIRPGSKIWIKRLNILLQFAHVDPWTLNNGAYEKLLDGLYFALMGGQRDRNAKTDFNAAATRQGVRDAQRGLKKYLDKNEDANLLPLKASTLVINEDADGFYYTFSTGDFPTMAYQMFAYILEASEVKGDNFLHCSHCGALFLPLRKPREGTPAYCSPKCASVVASRNYRKRQAAEKLEKKKMKKKRKPK